MRLFLALLFLPLTLTAQQHPHQYIQPTDPLVRQNLDEWRDLKFGLLMHWGTYSQWGIVESWSLCPEDEGWCERRGPFAADWYGYKKAYENLQTSFRPTRFNPEKWAAAAQAAGMRYVVFTTKHHDGFCMFDSKQTDYKITDPKCPFSKSPRADVTREIFNAFREKKFKVGAYFSKPDWHSPDFWWPYFPPKDRNISYDLNKYPERYQAFKDFTFRQLEELCTNYGRLDLLWLDGAWVRPANTIDRNESWQRGIPDGQDLDMPKIAAMARQKQPGILIVDRWVPGEYENYLTPEQGIPPTPLGVPWETCMTMGGSWSYVFEENYKSPHQLIHTLCQVVSKGGNLLLNIAPGPDGEWHPEAYERLQAIGAWMAVNSEAIYGTDTPASGLFQRDKFVFTQKGEILYAIYLADEQETKMPGQIRLTGLALSSTARVELLGVETKISQKMEGGDLLLQLPESIQQNPPCGYAWVFKIQQ
ncbi:MAG: alpha-L-fucosidase [Lewinellaceae bacterium]|nr:alpha-L-fucosidase [Saprospiraceae bacterium]MCB9329935.1 alpha-L-fucosidase [Lewinellaceae bacterium]